MKLKLIKIEEGFCRGNVTFHSLINMTKAEIKKQQDALKSKRELKEKRKKEQEENVRKKQEKNKKAQPEKGDDEYVTDPGEQSEVEEANADDTKQEATPSKPKLFANF
jgi:ribosome biogenesis protein SSF1/2